MHARERLHVLGEPESVVGLPPVVELLEDARRELLEHADDVHRPHRLRPPRGYARRVQQDAEVGADLGRDLRALDLDRHQSAVVHRGTVDLGGGGRRERFWFECGVELLGRRTQLLDDALAHLIGWERRDGILQLGELRRHVDGEHGRLTRHDLTDLHVGGPKFLEHEAELHRGARPLPAPGQAPDPGLHRMPKATDVGGPPQDRVVPVPEERVVHLLQAQVLVELVHRGAPHGRSSPAASESDSARLPACFCLPRLAASSNCSSTRPGLARAISSRSAAGPPSMIGGDSPNRSANKVIRNPLTSPATTSQIKSIVVKPSGEHEGEQPKHDRVDQHDDEAERDEEEGQEHQLQQRLDEGHEEPEDRTDEEPRENWVVARIEHMRHDEDGQSEGQRTHDEPHQQRAHAEVQAEMSLRVCTRHVSLPSHPDSSKIDEELLTGCRLPDGDRTIPQPVRAGQPRARAGLTRRPQRNAAGASLTARARMRRAFAALTCEPS